MFVNRHFAYLKCARKAKGVIMRNLHGTIFYMKTNVLQDFYICMSVPLKYNFEAIQLGVSWISIIFDKCPPSL